MAIQVVNILDLKPIDKACGYTSQAHSDCPSVHNYVVQAWSSKRRTFVDTRRGGNSVKQAERAELALRADKSAWINGQTTGTRVAKAIEVKQVN